jgi:colanic acid/amylovoran biosynthesis protein
MTRPVSRILIVNTHSLANAGDQAIVLGQLRLLREVYPDARVTITSRTSGPDRPFWAARGVAVIAPLFRAPADSPGKWRPWGKALLSLLLPWRGLAFLLRLKQADLVLACGGGYFYSYRRFPGLTFWQNYLHLRLAVAFRKEVVLLPQSFGPLANPLSRHLLAGLLASARIRAVLVREEVSLAVLEKLLPADVAKGKVRFCPDMAFYHEPEAEPPAAAAELNHLPRPRLAVALRDWDFPGQKTHSGKSRQRGRYIEGVVAACRDLHRDHGASFCFFSQVRGPSAAEDDGPITRLVHERLSALVPAAHLHLADAPSVASPDLIIGLLRQADLLVTSRMHAAVLAFLAGIPAVVIGYQHKSLGILNAMGMGSLSLPIEELQAEPLSRLYAAVLQDREEWRRAIDRSVLEMRSVIATTFRSPFPGWPGPGR